MLEMTDINQLIKPPDGKFSLKSVEAKGAFLVLTYHDGGVEYVKIFVNNGGREVLRVSGLG